MDRETRAEGETRLLETACDRERVALIFNPASGSEDSETRRRQLEELKVAAGLTCELRETDREQGAAPLAVEAKAAGMERVLVSGGDGSVMEAAGVLAGSPVALAVLPGGTGNLLALNLGLPAETEAAVELALTGRARPLDVGRANDRVFLIMAGIGLDARMIRDADRELKDRLGVLAYFVSAWRNLGQPSIPFTITIDGQRRLRRAQSVLVANLGRITGGLELVPGADPEDGLLDVAILRARGLRELAVIGWRALIGRRRSDLLLEIHRGREIVIETEQPQAVQLDGNEAEPATRLEIHVQPGALQLVRAPTTDATGEPLPGAPQAPLARGASAAAGPLLAGGVTVALLHLRAHTTSASGRRPRWVERHPLLAGMLVGALVGLLQRKRA